MSRRSVARTKHTDVELFPFLSILACTIGTLILLIIVLTTQALDPQEVTIVAKEGQGVNQSKTPRYIECRDDGIVLHPSQTFVPRADIKDSDSPLRQLIKEVKANKENEYLVVVLRPNGIDMFNQVRNLVESEGIDIGYEPIEYGLELEI